MARAKQAQEAQPPAVDVSGPSAFVRIVSFEEVASSFTLEDGTVLRIRPVLAAARRMLDQYSPDGDPIYTVTATLVISTQAPEKLRRPRVSARKAAPKAAAKKGPAKAPAKKKAPLKK